LSGSEALFLGLDAGTSGIRGVCIDIGGNTVASAGLRYGDDQEARRPEAWKVAVAYVLENLSTQVALDRIAGIAVDGQSGTVLLCDDDGIPLSPPKFYSEPATEDAVNRLTGCMLEEGQEIPATLGRVMDLWWADKPAHFHVVHQADWLAGLLCGRFDFSDENNSLKLGYDPSTTAWAFDAWALPFNRDALPEVFSPATPVGPVTALAVKDFGLSPDCQVFAGTTDGTAGFIAASGLENLSPGTAVTTLGTTLVIKSITPTRVDVSSFGIYSHRLFDAWVAGGASNSGGGALLKHFSPDDMTRLSAKIDPDQPTGLDYYPLVSIGERFPISDPGLKNKTEPRPDDDALFLAGLFESIARIEKRGFDLMLAHGVPWPTLVKTVGGGSRNPVWTKIRERILGTRVVVADQTEAAYGSALIALRGVRSK
jgi:D-ribulokinase